MQRFPQLSFAAGEISPETYARVDIAKYQAALEECLNFIVKRQGGVMNRAGLGFVAPTKYPDRETTLIPFEFNTEQNYVLEVGDEYMRVVKDGGLVLNAAQSITSISKADPAELGKVAHGYDDGEWVFVLAEGMTEVNGRFFEVQNKTADTFELVDVLTGDALDSSTFETFTAGTMASVFEVATPYEEENVFFLNYTQSNDVMTLTHQDYAPRDLSRTAHNAWTLAAITFTPEVDAPTSPAATNSTGTGSETYKYKITAQVDESGEESLATAEVSTTNDLSTVGNENTISWTAVAEADRYNVYKGKNSVFGYIGSTVDTSFVDDNIDPDLTDTPPEPRNPFAGASDYPSSVLYHEQRKVFAGTENDPQKVWATQTGRFKNMSVSTPTKDDDAWTFRIAARKANSIRHMVSLGDLLVFTSGGEWKFAAGAQGDSITPNSIQVSQQSENGSSFVRPLVVGSQVLYVHNMGRTVSDFGYSFEKDGYKGDELTILSSHLLQKYGLKQWAFHKEPYRCAWGIREDGTLLGFTYVREHEVWAWHRHVTDGKFKSVEVIQEGNEEFAYFIVQRTINGTTRQYIERMSSRFFDNMEDAFFVDCGLTFDNWNTNTGSEVTLTGGTDWTVDETLTLTENGTLSPFTSDDEGKTMHIRLTDDNGVITARARVMVETCNSSTELEVKPLQVVSAELRGVATSGYAFAQNTISNLWHIEGKDVAMLLDGDVASGTVENGILTLQTPAAKGHIGLGYNSDMKTLRIVGGPQNGALLGLKKTVTRIDMMIEESRGIFAGPDYDKLVEHKQRSTENYGEPTKATTGLIRIIPKASWNEGQFVIRQEDPLPLSILGVVPEVDIGG